MLSSHRRTSLICLFLAGITVVLFWPLTGHDFVSYDDGIYIIDNQHVNTGLSWVNVSWAFRTGYAGNWHPLTWISHMLDVQVFGLRPGWHHLVNLLFHAANTVLLFVLLNRTTGSTWRSAFVAALFGWHPLHVESVAWVAERKDVLSAFFFMLTLLAYAAYVTGVECRGGEKFEVRDSKFETNPKFENKTSKYSKRAKSRGLYILTLVLFALGLMAKPMLVSLPFVLLLLDFWPLRRVSGVECRGEDEKRESGLMLLPSARYFFRLVAEKLPFCALAAASCVATFIAQKGGGAVVPIKVLSFSERLENAIVACATYLTKMAWPAKLGILYPLRAEVPLGAILLSIAVLLSITAWTFRRMRNSPHLFVGWLWYLGMLIPVIGLVQVGMQQMADRYTYLPLIGVFIMIAWEVPNWIAARAFAQAGKEAIVLNPFQSGRSKALAIVACCILVSCLFVTGRQLTYWQNSETLFGRAARVTDRSYVALSNHGQALFRQGKIDEAIAEYAQAIALDPTLDAARLGMGEALMQQGKHEKAAEEFSKVLELQPENSAARLQLGVLRGRQGKYAEAIAAFSEVLRRDFRNIAAHNNLGNVLTLQGKHEEAVKQFEEAVQLDPSHATAHSNLALTYRKLGRTAEAIAQYREAIRLNPEQVEAINNLAWILATDPNPQFRDGTEAVQLATRACELTRYQHPAALATIAAAYAEGGHFTEAASFAEQALQIAMNTRSPLAAQLQKMLARFQTGQPFRDEKA
jgi:tetratricopeptide (TPR) repeat protein